MSHSTVLVLFPSKPDDVEAAVTRALAPFDKNIEVPEYTKPCYCIGSAARDAARKAAIDAHGNPDDIWSAFWRLHDAQTEDSEAIDAAWKIAIGPFAEARDAALAAHPEKDSPEHDCDACSGTGQRPMTYNPKSKWDWYVIGGRWEGLIPDDACNVAVIPPGVRTFAVLEPDGTWNEQGKMDWFGMVADEKDDWDAQFDALITKHREAFAVLVDVHI